MKSMMVVLFVMVLHTITNSQDLRFGIIASVNNETRTTKSHNLVQTGAEVKFKSETSYNYGLIALWKISSNLFINTSTIYSSKKVSTFWSGPADGPVNATLYFDYLSVSPKIEYNPLLGIYINAGPSIDVKFNTKLEQKGSYVEDQDEITGTNDLRFGLLFSLGYRLDFVGSSSFAVEVSYDLGITETNSRLGGKYSTSRAGLIFYFK